MDERRAARDLRALRVPRPLDRRSSSGSVDRLDIEADTERAKLDREVTKDKKILATLKERRRETFEAEAAAVEQRESDEINSRRFDRAPTTRETPS